MTENDLKCYACKDSNKKLCVCQIDSPQYKDWVISYKKDFRESYISIGDEPLNVQRHYFDPDQSYYRGGDYSFFKDLEIFLTGREKEMSNHLKGSFEYKFQKGKGIEVSDKDSKNKDIKPFYLRSDQFGFSAPVNEKCYPYDLYIMRHKNKDEAIEQVIEWIAMSRTIGGSFLWPEPFHKDYNPQRGGTINFRKLRYIQDRVDLTLWEIKDWYSNPDGGGILKQQSILKRLTEQNPALKDCLEHWLGHFQSFEIYIDYFEFGEFVESVDGFYNPINIITGKSDAPPRGANGKDPEAKITKSMKLDVLEEMLNTLNNKIVKRSIEMVDKIKCN